MDGLEKVTQVTGGHMSRLFLSGVQEVPTLEFRFLEVPHQDTDRLGVEVNQFTVIPTLSDDREGLVPKIQVLDPNGQTLLLTKTLVTSSSDMGPDLWVRVTLNPLRSLVGSD